VPHFVGTKVSSPIRSQVYQVAVLRHHFGYRSGALPFIKQLSTTLLGQYNNLVTLVELLMMVTDIIPPNITSLLFPAVIRGCCPKFVPKVLEILPKPGGSSRSRAHVSLSTAKGLLGTRPYTNMYGDIPVVTLGTSRNAHTINGTYLCHWHWCFCTT